MNGDYDFKKADCSKINIKKFALKAPKKKGRKSQGQNLLKQKLNIKNLRQEYNRTMEDLSKEPEKNYGK